MSSRDLTKSKPSQSGKKSRKAASRESTQKKLLAAALQVFAQKGFDAATTRMIATKAKVNEALIFRYFGDKSGLLMGVIMSEVESFDKEAEQYPRAQSLEEEVRNYLMFSHKDNLNDIKFLRVAVTRCLIDRGILDRFVERMPIFGNVVFVQRLRDLKDRGLIRPEADLERISSEVAMFCTGCMLTVLAVDTRYLPEIERNIESFARTIGEAWGTSKS